MITVAILINGQPLMARSAVNKSKGRITGACFYEVDDGSTIIHHPYDGAVALAIEMLKTIKGQRRSERGDESESENAT
jgi:hypothetical protein